MSDHNERPCAHCGSLLHHEDLCTREVSVSDTPLKEQLTAALAELEKVRAERDNTKMDYEGCKSSEEGAVQTANAALTQIAKLTKDRDMWQQSAGRHCEEHGALADQRDSLRARVTELEAQCAEKDEALRAVLKEATYFFSDLIPKIRQLVTNALSSTGSSFLDRMKRMEEALRIIKVRTDEKSDLPPFDNVKINFLARNALNPQEQTK